MFKVIIYFNIHLHTLYIIFLLDDLLNRYFHIFLIMYKIKQKWKYLNEMN